MIEPTIGQQLKGKANARRWRDNFKVAAHAKGVWDVFSGVFEPVDPPDPKAFGLPSAIHQWTNESNNDEPQLPADGNKSKENKEKARAKARPSLLPDEISKMIAAGTAAQATSADLSAKLAMFKFQLDEYDKGRKVHDTAMALLYVWVHESLRPQLAQFEHARQAYIWLLERYSISDVRALEVATNEFELTGIANFRTVQEYVNAIEAARADIIDAGGYCDNKMTINKIIRGLSGPYNEFVTQFHMLQEIDPNSGDLDHVITQLLTFESTLNSRRAPPARTGYNARPQNAYNGARDARAQCSGCGKWGHTEKQCWHGHPELRPQNNKPSNTNAANGYTKKPYQSYGNKGSRPSGMSAMATAPEHSFMEALNAARAAKQSANYKPGLSSSKPTPKTITDKALQEIKGLGDGGNGKLEDRLGNTQEPGSWCHKDAHNPRDVHTDSSIPPKKIQNVSTRASATNKNMSHTTKDTNICLAAVDTTNLSTDARILDSGANIYICNNRSWFKEFLPLKSAVGTASHESSLKITGGGTVDLLLHDPDEAPFSLTLTNVAYAPESRCNLISVSRLADAGIKGEWSKDGMKLCSEAWQIGTADLIDGLYHLRLESIPEDEDWSEAFAGHVDYSSRVWDEHRRLGHMGFDRMARLTEQSQGMKVTKEEIKAKLGEICPICETAKACTHTPRDPARRRFENLGDLLHIDSWGPYKVQAYDGTKYMVFITDDATRMTWCLRIGTKDEAHPKIIELLKQIERTQDVKIRRIRSDDEFQKGKLMVWCKDMGIATEPTVSYAHHQVGVAERANRTLREGAAAMIQDNNPGSQLKRIFAAAGQSLMAQTRIPEKYWPEAMQYAVWLKNRSPTSTLKWKKTPWEACYNYAPDLSRELTWGTRVYATLNEENRKKLAEAKLHGERAHIGYFMGCENESQYRIMFPDLSGKVQTIAFSHAKNGEGLEDDMPGAETKDRGDAMLRVMDAESEDDEVPTTSRFFGNDALVTTRRQKQQQEEDLEEHGVMGKLDIPDNWTTLYGTDETDNEVAKMFPQNRNNDTDANEQGSASGNRNNEDSDEGVSPRTVTRERAQSIDLTSDDGPLSSVPEESEDETGHFFDIDEQPEVDTNNEEENEEDEDGEGEEDGPILEAPEDSESDHQDIDHKGEETNTDREITRKRSRRKRGTHFDLSDSNADSDREDDWQKHLGTRAARQLEKDKKKCGACYSYKDKCVFEDGNAKCKWCIRRRRICAPVKFDEDGKPISEREKVGYQAKSVKCEMCYKRSSRCSWTGGNTRCDSCHEKSLVCKPLELDSDENPIVPTKRVWKKGLPVNDKCQRCWSTRRACDATLPIDENSPCTLCVENNAICVTQELWERMKTEPKCRFCEHQERRCTLGVPCAQCVKQNSPSCIYGTDWVQTRNAVGMKFKSPEDASCCGKCFWKGYTARRNCDATPGKPCRRCITSKVWCRVRVSENQEAQAHGAAWIWDDDTEDYVFNPEAAGGPPADDPDGEDVPTDIYSGESRQATRDKLMSLRLPDSFLAVAPIRCIPIRPMAVAMAVAKLGLLPDPQTYNEAIRAPDAEEWRKAIQTEYDSLMENNTWRAVDLPPGRKALTTKWVLKKKLGPQGQVLRYKARMVARGFQQVEGYDYTETYSGVVKASAVRLLFAMAVLAGWMVHQMDVTTAFLNGEVYEEVYIHPPQGYPTRGKVLRLLKALYGLKQAPRLWYRKLRQWLLAENWVISAYDECVFHNSERTLIISVYVDDINIFGKTEKDISDFKRKISNAFKMTDQGIAAWYLGMQLEWNRSGLHIHQDGYAQQILSKFGLIGATTTPIPLDPNRKLKKETEETAEAKFKTKYMSMVGSLNYLQTKTMWDIAFPISLVSRFNANPNQTHMDAVLQIYRYITDNARFGLQYSKQGSSDIEGCVDSDWGGDPDTGRSTTGWVFTLAGAPISWASQRQKTVASSSTEAEYIAASDATKEAIWLKGFRNELASYMGIPLQHTIRLSIDNASAIKLTRNPEFHGRTKHIPIRHHFIREAVERGDVTPIWIPGRENPADLLTKPLNRPTFEKHLLSLRGSPDSISSSATD